MIVPFTDRVKKAWGLQKAWGLLIDRDAHNELPGFGFLRRGDNPALRG